MQHGVTKNANCKSTSSKESLIKHPRGRGYSKNPNQTRSKVKQIDLPKKDENMTQSCKDFLQKHRHGDQEKDEVMGCKTPENLDCKPIASTGEKITKKRRDRRKEEVLYSALDETSEKTKMSDHSNLKGEILYLLPSESSQDDVHTMNDRVSDKEQSEKERDSPSRGPHVEVDGTFTKSKTNKKRRRKKHFSKSKEHRSASKDKDVLHNSDEITNSETLYTVIDMAKDELIEGEESEVGIPKTKKNLTDVIQTNIKLEIYEEIRQNSKLMIKRYIESKMADDDTLPDHEIISQSVSDITTLLLRFRSHNQAKKAAIMLNRINKTKPFCKATVIQPRVDEEKEKLMSKKAMVKGNIESKSKLILEKHNQKIAKQEEDFDEILKLCETYNDLSYELFEKTQLEKEAVVHKTEELIRQREEFENKIEKISQNARNAKTFKELEEIEKSFGFERSKMFASLPIFGFRQEITQHVSNNQVTVLLGETGSGKSTQLVQFMAEMNSFNGTIVCTQPRKVAATSLAERVAEEHSSRVGDEIGYRVGMRRRTSKNTRVIFMTDHTLLNEFFNDPEIKKYNCVIIDEAHERSIYSDLLIGMLKRCLPKRPDLRVIITSATIDPAIFTNYFSDCPVINIPGRTYPVDVEWCETESQNTSEIVKDTIRKTAELHHTYHTDPSGDILVFLPTPMDTEQACEILHRYIGKKESFECFPFHGKLQPDEQSKVFKPVEKDGVRKIIFATNSAETSLTIVGVKYVVDSGLVKEKRFDPKRNMSSLDVVMINKSSANQRKGRAGRTQSGKCYRMYSEEDYNNMEENDTPEILRVNLGLTILQLLDLGIEDPMNFDFIQPPSKDATKTAYESLCILGLIKEREITESGRKVSKLNLEPRLGLLTLMGIEQGVGMEALSIAASMTVSGSIFFRTGTNEEKEKADMKKMPFCDDMGDLITNLNVFREWMAEPEKKKTGWCMKNSISAKAMRMTRDSVKELRDVLEKDLSIQVEYSFNDDTAASMAKLKMILQDCYKQNVCIFSGHDKLGYYSPALEQYVKVHPGSSLRMQGLQPKWLVFVQHLKTSQDFIVDLTPVDESWVEKCIESGSLTYNFEELKECVLEPETMVNLSKTVAFKLCGKAFTTLHKLEDDIKEKINDSHFTIDLSIDDGNIKIFAKRQHIEVARGVIQEAIDNIKEPLKKETREVQLKRENNGVRAILSAGGTVEHILMPTESHTVLIRFERNEKESVEDTNKGSISDNQAKVNAAQSEEDIKKRFETYGKILKCYKFPNQRYQNWGKLTYQDHEEAKNAIEGTKNDAIRAVPERKNALVPLSGKYRVKLKWLRRPKQKYAFVMFSSIDDAQMAVRHIRELHINGQRLRLSPTKNAKRNCEVYVSNVAPDVTEDKIKQDLKSRSEELDLDIQIIRVQIPRVRAFETTEGKIDEYREILERHIERYVKKDRFRVDIIKPRDVDFEARAYVEFEDALDGQETVEKLQNSQVLIDAEPVTFESGIRCVIPVPAAIYRVTKEEAEMHIASLKEYTANIAIKVDKNLKQNNKVVKVEISSLKVKDIALAHSVLSECFRGSEIDCSRMEILQNLLSEEGYEFLKNDVSNHEYLHVEVDKRRQCVGLHGSSKHISKAQRKVNDYLDEIEKGQSQVHTKLIPIGRSRPKGFLKALVKNFGSDLQGLKETSQAESLKLNVVKKNLEVKGDSDVFECVESAINKICSDLLEQQGDGDSTEKDCAACYSSADKLYRLEYCGHPYCKDCIKTHISVMIKDRRFPIQCIECEGPLVYKDFLNMLGRGTGQEEKFVQSAVSAYIAKHTDTVRHCLTPGCNSVYKVTKEGGVFQCPECNNVLCTTCHIIPYHSGMTCAMYQSMKTDPDYELQRYIDEDPENRKRCPKCRTLIEKNKGCNHVACSNCHSHLCWLCLEVCSSSTSCYDHLDRIHGGIFDNENDLIYEYD
ncbi:unnamed protein product [Owenia fusiformis]|uniref:Uncharacterized protein n=1 Tax=Owenia fusiformis TaxID=6347 RepID=A0A8J1UY40_OWEFU|nr:unnamed protein product [Owenia fusiformis]